MTPLVTLNLYGFGPCDMGPDFEPVIPDLIWDP
jgi:hypothetical protein